MNLENYESIKNVIKTEWKNDIDKENDIEKLSKYSQHYVKVLEHLKTLSEITKQTTEEVNGNIIDIDIEQNNDENTQEFDNSKLENNDEHKKYLFHRNLVGGNGVNLDNSKDTLYVPEGAVRYSELEHGDVFEYIPDGLGEGRNYFKKVDELSQTYDIEKNRTMEYDYAVIERDAILNMLVCNSYLDENGETKKVAPVLINQNDLDKFDIKDGDIVALGYSMDSSRARIRWKYDSSFAPVTPSKKSSYYKEKSESKEDEDFDENEFKDLTIGIIGATTFISNFVEETEKRGGKIEHTDAHNKLPINSMVSKSDVVVIPINHAGHKQVEMAREIAKSQDKSFIILETHGRSNFVNQIREYLSENSN